MLISKWKLAEFPVLVRRQVVNMHCYPDNASYTAVASYRKAILSREQMVFKTQFTFKRK